MDYCIYLIAQNWDNEVCMEYFSIRQIAEKWGLSKRRVQILCAEERIPGAIRIDSSWAIPADAEKPVDARIKSGKYIKQKNKNGDNGNGKKTI